MKLVTLVLLFVLSICSNGLCSCIDVEGMDTQWDYSIVDLIFTGKVEKLEIKKDADIFFKVIKQYKGERSNKIVVFQPACLYAELGYTCWIEDDPTFKKGKEYLVYAVKRKSGKYEVLGCCGEDCNLLKNSLKDIAALDEISAAMHQHTGDVPDAGTAIKIASGVLVAMYGEKQIKGDQPFKAELENNNWIVKKAIYCNEDDVICLGNFVSVEISKIDGKILKVSHGD